MKTDPVRYFGSQLMTSHVMRFVQELGRIAGKGERDFLFIEPYSIGDAVHTLGLLPRFREVYCEPDQRIILLCQERAASLAAIMPFADAVVGHQLSPELDLQLEYVASLSNGLLSPQLPIVCASYMHAFGAIGRLVITSGPLAVKRSMFFLKQDDPWQAPVVSDHIRTAMEQRLAALGLERGKGLIVLPRGHTLKDLEPAFWEAAVRGLKARFPYLRVFTETGRNPPIEGTEPLRLSLAELIPAVEYAGAGLALRSGLVDVLAHARADIVSLAPPAAFYHTVPPGFLPEDLFVGGWFPGATVRDLALTGGGAEAAEAVAGAFRGRAAMHVIVQAGGRGSRLRHHTWNKPKCLVSVHGKPVLYHLFDRFPGARFVVIGDYAFEVLKAYLEYNPPPAEYDLVRASAKGTVSGIAQALELVPPDEPTLIVWSDLLIGPDVPAWPESSEPVVGLTDDFTCRWSLRPDGTLAEVPSPRNGIPGIFYVGRRADLPAPPETGEFMAWFVRAVPRFQTRSWTGLREIGDFAVIEAMNGATGFTRFFNKVEIAEETVRKSAVEPAYAELIDREIAWYREARALGFERIPAVLGEQPFVMQRVQGLHPWQLSDLTARERRAVLADAVDALSGLHARGAEPWREAEAREVYLDKTRSRVESVRALIPMIDRPSVTVNGLKCRNPFSERHTDLLPQLYAGLGGGQFRPIHGDPTFSNILVDQNLRAWFIDPRGYFAKPGLYGDPLYDFAKLYYSAAGGYDGFNRRQFKLHVDEDTVEILMEAPAFADAAEAIFGGDFAGRLAEIRILHGLIWLSLSGYVRDDVDSVIAAFFLGLYWLERARP